MSQLQFHKVNESILRVSSNDSGILMELAEHFTFMAEGYKFIPSFRNKMWDGKIRLYDSRTGKLPYGLLFDALKFAKSRDYSIELSHEIVSRVPPSIDELKAFAASLKITNGASTISPRDYQLDAYCHACTEGRSLIISPTGSGKSLIIYLTVRWFLEHHDEKVLLVVPTTSLVEQMTKDFADYSTTDDSFNAEEEIHKIYSGKEKNNFDSRIVITTWQSAITCPTPWFREYGMVIGDEAHLFKAKSLNTIMAACVNASYRIGATGTLDGSQCNERVLVGNFGPVHKVISTKELIDNNTLADLKVKCIVLNHTDELKKSVSKMDYKGEIDTLVSLQSRNNFIAKLAVDQTGNTLVLFNYVEKHGKPLHVLIRSMCGDERKVFYVSGEVNATDRENIREITEQEKNAIIVASTGTFSTGINIKNLHQIIFASPTKSQIRVLQSIGRGLRKSDNGNRTTVYDISDNFSWKKKKNYTMTHAIERIKIYAKEQFDYKIYEIDLQ